MQFQDPEIWKGTKKPDYGRVVNICTNTAQKELVGPGLLAIAPRSWWASCLAPTPWAASWRA